MPAPRDETIGALQHSRERPLGAARGHAIGMSSMSSLRALSLTTAFDAVLSISFAGRQRQGRHTLVVSTAPAIHHTRLKGMT